MQFNFKDFAYSPVWNLFLITSGALLFALGSKAIVLQHQFITGGIFGSNYQDVFAFLVLIGVLVFRPSGLIGEKVSEGA